MKQEKMKNATVVTLLTIAFVFFVCINPSDNSETFLEDLLVVKTIAGISFALALGCIRYWHTENSNS